MVMWVCGMRRSGVDEIWDGKGKVRWRGVMWRGDSVGMGWGANEVGVGW